MVLKLDPRLLSLPTNLLQLGGNVKTANRLVAEGSEALQCLSVQVETGPVCEFKEVLFKYLRIIIRIWLRAGGDPWVRGVSRSISCSYRL